MSNTAALLRTVKSSWRIVTPYKPSKATKSPYSEHIRSVYLIIISVHSALRFVRSVRSVQMVTVRILDWYGSEIRRYVNRKAKQALFKYTDRYSAGVLDNLVDERIENFSSFCKTTFNQRKFVSCLWLYRFIFSDKKTWFIPLNSPKRIFNVQDLLLLQQREALGSNLDYNQGPVYMELGVPR